MRATSGALMHVSSQPARILAVTGSRVAFETAETISPIRSGSRISALPSPFPVIFGAGQPKFRSMNSNPALSSSCAARAISSGSRPNSCSPAMPSPGKRVNSSRVA